MWTSTIIFLILFFFNFECSSHSRARARKPTVGFTSTCLKAEVNDHPTSLGVTFQVPQPLLALLTAISTTYHFPHNAGLALAPYTDALAEKSPLLPPQRSN
jgi:hypothetical protein